MSYEENPSGYTRIKIKELETDIEEQKLHKDRLDVEKKERKLTNINYEKDYKKTNKRINQPEERSLNSKLVAYVHLMKKKEKSFTS